MKKWLIYLILFLLALNIAMVSVLLFKTTKETENQVETEKRFKNKFPGRFEEHIALQLEFDSKQKDQLNIFRKKFMQQRKAGRMEIHGLQKQYFELISQPRPDTILLDQLSREIGRIEADRIKQDFIHYQNIRSICNEVQAEKLDSISRIQMHKRFMRRGSEFSRRHGKHKPHHEN